MEDYASQRSTSWDSMPYSTEGSASIDNEHAASTLLDVPAPEIRPGNESDLPSSSSSEALSVQPPPKRPRCGDHVDAAEQTASTESVTEPLQLIPLRDDVSRRVTPDDAPVARRVTPDDKQLQLQKQWQKWQDRGTDKQEMPRKLSKQQEQQQEEEDEDEVHKRWSRCTRERRPRPPLQLGCPSPLSRSRP